LINVSENCSIASVPNFPENHEEHRRPYRGRKAGRGGCRPNLVEVIHRRLNLKLPPNVVGVGAVEEQVVTAFHRMISAWASRGVNVTPWLQCEMLNWIVALLGTSSTKIIVRRPF
jgi:hypothetical protein